MSAKTTHFADGREAIVFVDVEIDGSYIHPTAILASYDSSRDEVNGVRHYDDWPARKGIRADELQLQGQANRHDEPSDSRHTYAWEIGYSRPYFVTSERAQSMAKTLAAIGRTIDTAERTYGRAKTFGAYVAMFAAAVGVSRVLLRCRDTDRIGRFGIYDPGQAIRCIDELIESQYYRLANDQAEPVAEEAAA